MSIKLIIFDLDGTLVNSIVDITNSINCAIEPCGLSPKTVEDVAALVGEGITKVIERILGEEKFQYREAAVKRFLDFYSEHIVDNTLPYPGVRETLKALNGYKKAVVSNKREAFSIKVLQGLDLIQYFDVVLGSDSVNEKKPSPAPVLQVLSTLGMTPDDAVMVGDSSHDIEAGKRAGVRTVGVTYGYRDRSHLSAADFMIDDMKELMPIIKSLC